MDALEKKQALLATGQALTTSVEQVSPQLDAHLANLGLPTADVLVPFAERRAVIEGLGSAIDHLDETDRAKAHYISKFAVASLVGLFDASLNYLWNETINALRRLVVDVDLSYFFDVVEKREKYREKLQTAEDLKQLDDITLIDGCAKTGLISDTNRERLRHVLYMRNHASAAHPNQNDLNGAELISWLNNCLRYVISFKPDLAALEVQKLLHHVREQTIPSADVGLISSEIGKLRVDRADDLLWTAFGMFVDPTTSATARANLGLLAPAIWGRSTESRRYEVGARYGYFAKHADQTRKELALDFLKRVDGLGYRSEDVISAELLEKLQTLRRAHFAFNNFYNEWPIAESLAQLLPHNGIVPRPVRREWVSTITQCLIGNGNGRRNGVDESAASYYKKFIEAFTEADIAEFIGLFFDKEFTVDFDSPMAEERARKIVQYFRGRATDPALQNALDVIQSAPARTLRKLENAGTFKAAAAQVAALQNG